MSTVDEVLIASGGTAWLCRFEGVVQHADRNFETRLTSTAGRGWVGPNGGYVETPQISSSTIDHQTIFVRAADGSEKSFEWRHWNLPVRPGSRVAVIWGARNGSPDGAYIAARNLDTDEERWREVASWAGSQGLLSGKLRVWPSMLVAVLMGGFFSAIAYYARLRSHGSTSGPISEFLLASAIAFVPVVVIEWVVAVLIRANDGEHVQIHEALARYLRTGDASMKT